MKQEEINTLITGLAKVKASKIILVSKETYNIVSTHTVKEPFEFILSDIVKGMVVFSEKYEYGNIDVSLSDHLFKINEMFGKKIERFGVVYDGGNGSYLYADNDGHTYFIPYAGGTSVNIYREAH